MDETSLHNHNSRENNESSRYTKTEWGLKAELIKQNKLWESKQLA
ncbi:hypothetical protein VB713_03930 [Anabaena cylindrica UHCC 0172]|nr:hypothetical protein [Anabaena cylindrica]MEA5550137.1 hypothetical protein [Anabaena cylindrica UHCC 0172]